jgi:hypothetical protein
VRPEGPRKGFEVKGKLAALIGGHAFPVARQSGGRAVAEVGCIATTTTAEALFSHSRAASLAWSRLHSPPRAAAHAPAVWCSGVRSANRRFAHQPGPAISHPIFRSIARELNQRIRPRASQGEIGRTAFCHANAENDSTAGTWVTPSSMKAADPEVPRAYGTIQHVVPSHVRPNLIGACKIVTNRPRP